MATHSAFLRQTGVDGRTIGINSQRQIRVNDYTFNPNAAFGKVYWVDKASGSDSSDGLSPEGAFLTVEQAITISNAEVGSYDMNTIYVNSNTYSETLTALPRNANVIGIGAKVRLSGVQTFVGAQQNGHFWNIQFRQDTAAPHVTIPSTCYNIGFHGCTFENNGGSVTHGMSIGAVHDLMIEDCRFFGGPAFPIGIEITGYCIRGVIQNNRIAATTDGILIADAVDGYQNLIYHNIIDRESWDPNSAAQMTRGIKETRADGHSGWIMTRNFISAADAIYFGLADTASANMTIANSVVEGGTGVMENPLT
jgi:hypothetical protein